MRVPAFGSINIDFTAQDPGVVSQDNEIMIEDESAALITESGDTLTTE